jgi:hypothetical protein
MYSNFISPPDTVENLLVVNANQEQLIELANKIAKQEKLYNVYVYNTEMNNLSWVFDHVPKMDRALINRDRVVEFIVNVTRHEYFGTNERIKAPADIIV